MIHKGFHIILDQLHQKAQLFDNYFETTVNANFADDKMPAGIDTEASTERFHLIHIPPQTLNNKSPESITLYKNNYNHNFETPYIFIIIQLKIFQAGNF